MDQALIDTSICGGLPGHGSSGSTLPSARPAAVDVRYLPTALHVCVCVNTHTVYMYVSLSLSLYIYMYIYICIYIHVYR